MSRRVGEHICEGGFVSLKQSSFRTLKEMRSTKTTIPVFENTPTPIRRTPSQFCPIMKQNCKCRKENDELLRITTDDYRQTKTYAIVTFRKVAAPS